MPIVYGWVSIVNSHSVTDQMINSVTCRHWYNYLTIGLCVVVLQLTLLTGFDWFRITSSSIAKGLLGKQPLACERMEASPFGMEVYSTDSRKIFKSFLNNEPPALSVDTPPDRIRKRACNAPARPHREGAHCLPNAIWPINHIHWHPSNGAAVSGVCYVGVNSQRVLSLKYRDTPSIAGTWIVLAYFLYVLKEPLREARWAAANFLSSL